MPQRSPLVSLAWTLRDYATRIWDNASEDNVLFLAGGIAFNILLAAVPFVLLLVTGLTYLLPSLYSGQIDTATAIRTFVDRLIPVPTGSGVHRLLTELLNARTSVGIYSALGFVWFSTRLFGSLRTVLADVFDIEAERGIIEGKIFDVKITIIATLLFVASTAITTYVSVATSRGVAALVAFGLRERVMGGVEYWIGRILAFMFIALMFFALYKYLPIRRIRTGAAWVATLFTSVLFEIAKIAFGVYVRTFNPGSFYTGTLTAVIIVVIWVYYAALIFILGGEVGQVYELRRVRQLQREVFTD